MRLQAFVEPPKQGPRPLRYDAGTMNRTALLPQPMLRALCTAGATCAHIRSSIQASIRIRQDR